MPEFEYAVELVDIEGLIPNDENYNSGDVGAVATAIAVDGWHGSVICQAPTARRKRPKIFAGETRWRALRSLNRDGFTFPDGEHKTYDELAAGDVLLPPKGKVPAQLLPLADLRALRKLIADNEAARRASPDQMQLLDLLKRFEAEDGLLGTLYDGDDLDALLRDLDLRAAERQQAEAGPAVKGPSLADRFLVPPFSVLDARQGYWQERKRQWIGVGLRGETIRDLRSEDGRPDGVTISSLSGRIPSYYADKAAVEAAIGHPLTNPEFEAEYLSVADYGGISTSGTSVFDPVLCELVYRWLTPSDGMVLDPFAGGSVRGVVASRLRRRYVGIELRAEQIEANRQQAEDLCDATPPVWIEGDARIVLAGDDVGRDVDLVFTCPPYGDLESYSDDPADLSNMPYEEFRGAYRDIVQLSLDRLAEDRFACYVVGDIRGPDGTYRGLIRDTIDAFAECGAQLYNEAILVQPVGSLPVRIGRQFAATRKLGKTHQNVLVFVRGDPHRAVEACGSVEIPDVLVESIVDPAL